MTRNIYHSQKKLALEFFLVKLLALLAKSLEHDAIFAHFRTQRLGEFLLAVNQFNQQVERSPHHQTGEIKRQFLQTYYIHYKELCDYDVFALIKALANLKDDHPVVQIATRLHYRKMPKIIRLDQRDDKMMHEVLQTFKATHHDFQDWQLSLIKTPHQSYSGEEDPIFVVNEEGIIKPIGSFSFMIQAISDKLEHIVFLCIDSVIVEDKRVVALLKQLQSSDSI